VVQENELYDVVLSYVEASEIHAKEVKISQ